VKTVVQLPSWLGNIIVTGDVTVSTANKEALHVKAEDKTIQIDAVDKAFVKQVIGSMRQGTAGQGSSLRRSLDQIKDVAEELRNDGLTVAVTYQGKRVVTLGVDAKPKISRIVTGNAIEINSLRKLIELGF
jgi:hypothetical protein